MRHMSKILSLLVLALAFFLGSKPLYALEVTHIIPNKGPEAGNTQVILIGTDLSDVTAVNFGNATTTKFVKVSDTQITLFSPAKDPGDMGTVNITVTDGSSTSAETSANEYEYLDLLLPAVFEPQTASGLGSGTYPTGIIWSDFNNDGNPDLVTGNITQSHVKVNGTAITTNSGPRNFVAADFDNDGKIDLATADAYANKLSILINNGTGSAISFLGKVDVSTSYTPNGIVSGDFNGDGFADLAVCAYSGSDVTIYENNGSGGFGAGQQITGLQYPTAIGMGDFDNDGDLDLAVTLNSLGKVVILKNNGGTFSTGGNFSCGSFPYAISTADFNLDGKTDLAIVNASGGNAVTLLKNTSSGSNITFASGIGGMGTLHTPLALAVGDLNGDGKMDVVSSDGPSNNITIGLNTGTAVYNGGEMLSINYLWGIAIVDLNDDGRVDMACVNHNSHQLQTFLAGEADVVWTGAQSQDWSAAGNWLNSIEPYADAVVLIPGIANYQPYVSTDETSIIPKQIILQDGATLTIETNGKLKTKHMSVPNGGTFRMHGGECRFTGNFVNHGSADLEAGTVLYVGTSAQVVGKASYYNLEVSTTGSASMQGETEVKNNMNINSGASFHTNGNELDVRGNLAINSGASFFAGASHIHLGGNWTKGGTFYRGTSTLEFDGLEIQNINSTGNSFYDLMIHNTQGYVTTNVSNTIYNNLTVEGKLTLIGSIQTVKGSLLVYDTGELTVNSTTELEVEGDVLHTGVIRGVGPQIDVKGNWFGSVNFNFIGKVRMNKSTAHQNISQVSPGPLDVATFFYLEVSKGAYSAILTPGTRLNVTGSYSGPSVRVLSGSLDWSGKTVETSGDVTVDTGAAIIGVDSSNVVIEGILTAVFTGSVAPPEYGGHVSSGGAYILNFSASDVMVTIDEGDEIHTPLNVPTTFHTTITPVGSISIPESTVVESMVWDINTTPVQVFEQVRNLTYTWVGVAPETVNVIRVGLHTDNCPDPYVCNEEDSITVHVCDWEIVRTPVAEEFNQLRPLDNAAFVDVVFGMETNPAQAAVDFDWQISTSSADHSVSIQGVTDDREVTVRVTPNTQGTNQNPFIAPVIISVNVLFDGEMEPCSPDQVYVFELSPYTLLDCAPPAHNGGGCRTSSADNPKDPMGELLGGGCGGCSGGSCANAPYFEQGCVDPATGAAIVSIPVISIRNRGAVSFDMELVYSSDCPEDKGMGFGWGHNYNTYIDTSEYATGTAYIHNGYGRVEKLSLVSGDVWKMDSGTYSVNITSGSSSSFCIENAGKTCVKYEGDMGTNRLGISFISDSSENGNPVELIYSGGKLVTIKDAYSENISGREITFAYTSNRLTSITDFNDRSLDFVYDTAGNLIKIRHFKFGNYDQDDDTRPEYEFTYAAANLALNKKLGHKLLTVKSPFERAAGGIFLTYDYYFEPDVWFAGRVKSWTDHFNNTVAYVYSVENPFPFAEVDPEFDMLKTPTQRVHATDKNGNVAEFMITAGGVVVDMNALDGGCGCGNIFVKAEYTAQGRIHKSHSANYTETAHQTDYIDLSDTNLPVVRDTFKGLPVRRTRTPFTNQTANTEFVNWEVENDQEELVSQSGHEPFFNTVYRHEDERGLVSYNFLDYQEGSVAAVDENEDFYVADDLAALLHITEQEVRDLLDYFEIPTNLGDVNGDGLFQVQGNVIASVEPEVSPSAAATNVFSVTTYTYNEFGKLTSVMDAERNLTIYTYWNDLKPHGFTVDDPNLSSTELDPSDTGDADVSFGGWTARVISDASATDVTAYFGTLTRDIDNLHTHANDPVDINPVDTARNNGNTTANPVSVKTDTFYDNLGNVIKTVDARGVVTHYVLNEINLVTQIIRNAEASRASGRGGSFSIVTNSEGDETIVEPAGGFQFVTKIFHDPMGRVIARFAQNDNADTGEGAAGASALFTALGISAPNYYPAGEAGFIESYTAYDHLGRVIGSSQEVGTLHATGQSEVLVSRSVYDANGNLIASIMPEGNINSYAYDSYNKLIREVRGDDDFNALNGGPANMPDIRYEYDGDLQLRRVIDGADNDGNGLPEVSLTEYDGFGRVKRSISPFGAVSKNIYDENSNVVAVETYGTLSGPANQNNDETGNVLLSQSIMEYDNRDRVYRSWQTLFDYDAEYDSSYAIRSIALDGNSAVDDPTIPEGAALPGAVIYIGSQVQYDRLGRVVLRKDDDTGEDYETLYDGLGRTHMTTDPLNNTVTWEYDDNSNVLRVFEHEESMLAGVADENFVSYSFYDALNRLIQTRDNFASGPDTGNHRDFVYDSLDRLIIQYDAKNGVDQDQQNDSTLGNKSIMIYDGIGRMVKKESILTDNGKGSGTEDDDQGGGDGRITAQYEYDDNSRLIKQIDDNGKETIYEYDDANRRTLSTFDDGKTVSTVYDADSVVQSVTDQNGTVQTYTYDGGHRVTALSVAYASGNPSGLVGTKNQTFEYDGLSRRIACLDDVDGTLSNGDDWLCKYRFDSLGRLAEEQQAQADEYSSPGPKVTSHRYQDDNDHRELTYPNGRMLLFDRDALDRATLIWDSGADYAQYSYIGPGSRILKKTLANGTTAEYSSSGKGYSFYDQAKRLLKVENLGPVAENLGTFDYVFDREHNRLSEERSDDAMKAKLDGFGYDSNYRMLSADLERSGGNTSQSWEIDGTNNWETFDLGSGSQTATANNMNEYDGTDSFGTQDRSHDDNGNLNADGSFVYKYDFKNRLRKVYLSNGTTLIASYDYDAMDRRIHRKVENSGDLNVELYYYYDGISCIQENKVTGGSEALIFHYVNGIRIDEVINLFHFFGASGTEYYYHYDGKGWVIALTEGSESGQTPGAIHRRYEYTPYGVTSIFTDNYTAVSENDAFDVTDNSIAYNRTLYAGREYDPETNLYYYRARHYSPETGRFIQRDPIGYGDPWGLMNLYCYVGCNPVNLNDPQGLATNPKMIKIRFAAFIHKKIGEWFDEPGSVGWLAKSDNRDFGEDGTSRLYFEAEFDLWDIGNLDKSKMTFSVDTGWSATKKGTNELWDKADAKSKVFVWNDNKTDDKSSIEVKASAAYPFHPLAPDIDFNVKWDLVRIGCDNDDLRVRAHLTGTHDGFPFYEASIGAPGKISKPFYKFEPKESGPGFGNLVLTSIEVGKFGNAWPNKEGFYEIDEN